MSRLHQYWKLAVVLFIMFVQMVLGYAAEYAHARTALHAAGSTAGAAA